MRKVRQISLDNTSSVIVASSGRKIKGRRKVPKFTYEVEYKGVKIRCATVEEAASVARELGESADAPQYAAWEMHDFLDFVGRIQLAQRRLLAILLRQHGQPTKDHDLCKELGLGSNQGLAGVLSGITKVAQTMDIDPRRVYWQRTEYAQGKPERRYYPANAFMKAATDADWPSASDLTDEDRD